MGLFNREENKSSRRALNLSRKTVTKQGVTLPIPNLNALMAIRTLTAGEKDEMRALLSVVWVLRLQGEERILEVADNPPSAKELAELGREIGADDLPNYVACLQEILSLLGGKK